jgi:octaprenyl-diphosphate synthase
VLSYRRGDDKQREFWKRVMEAGDQRDGDLDHAIHLMNQHGAIDDTIDRARHYGAIARDALEIFPDSDYKAAMVDAIGFSVARAH